ncbi:MAG: glycosyltransferase family 39 protein [Thermomicrobiales bacterium]
MGHWAVELVGVLALCGVAAAVRWPYLMRLPKFTDETVEVRVFQIVEGQAFPLTAFDPINGPIHAYVLAAFFKIFGYHMVLPRLVSLVFGALTIGAIYLLGKAIAGGGRGAGGGAAADRAAAHRGE